MTLPGPEVGAPRASCAHPSAAPGGHAVSWTEGGLLLRHRCFSPQGRPGRAGFPVSRWQGWGPQGWARWKLQAHSGCWSCHALPQRCWCGGDDGERGLGSALGGLGLTRALCSSLQGPVGPKGERGSAGPQGSPGLKVTALHHLYPVGWSRFWSPILPGRWVPVVTPAPPLVGAWSVHLPSRRLLSCRGRRGSPASSSALMGPWSLRR